jgi:hypothetical protein
VAISVAAIPATPFMTPATPFPAPSSMIEATAGEVSPVVSLEEGAIVTEVYPVTIVTIPGRVVIIGITGVIRFTNGGRCVVATVCGSLVIRRILIDRLLICRFLINGLLINRLLIDRCGVYPDAGDAKTNVSVYVYLGIAFGSDEASGYNCGEHQYLFHICRFLVGDALLLLHPCIYRYEWKGKI